MVGEVGMNGNEVTTTDMKKWEKDGMIPVACRLCGKVVLYLNPNKFYKKEELTSYECTNCKMLLRLWGKVV